MSFVHMHVSEWMRHNTEMSWVNIDSCDPRIVHIWTVELQRKFAALFCPSETSGGLKKLTGVVGRSSVTTGKAVAAAAALLSCCIMCRLSPRTVSSVNIIGLKTG